MAPFPPMLISLEVCRPAFRSIPTGKCLLQPPQRTACWGRSCWLFTSLLVYWGITWDSWCGNICTLWFCHEKWPSIHGFPRHLLVAFNYDRILPESLEDDRHSLQRNVLLGLSHSKSSDFIALELLFHNFQYFTNFFQRDKRMCIFIFSYKITS